MRAIATEPHPVGSAADARVREYLLDQLRKLGLEPEVQTADMMSRTVQNVIARIPRSQSAILNPQSAILLVAHYDSVVYGPGAGDDTAAVGALLETARCLRAGPALKRDVILLLTDGEEAGLLGARAFCADKSFAFKENITRDLPAQSRASGSLVRHPFFDDVAMVLNFDARGTSGPAIMFETGPANLELIRHFAAAAPRPIANSLSYDVYKMLRNDTDFTVFRRSGKQALNFAFISNYVYYHTKFDTVEHLNPGSVYHDGRSALALTRHFAAMEADELAAVVKDAQPNAVYFNLGPCILVRYPATWIWPLAGAQLALAAAAVIAALRRGAVSAGGLGGAVLRLGLALLIAPAAVYGLTSMMGRAFTAQAFYWQLLAAIGVTVVIAVMLAATPVRFVKSRVGPGAMDRAAVVLILLSALSIPINLRLPGGSFVFCWTLMAVALNLLVVSLAPERRWLGALTSIVAIAPVALLFAPLAVQLFTALTLAMAWACSAAVVLAVWMMLAAAATARGVVIEDR